MPEQFTTTPAAAVSARSAQALIAAAEAKARELDKRMVIAVVDNGGNLTAFLRMDGAPLLSVAVATSKAWTSAAFGVATHDLSEFIKGDATLAVGVPPIPGISIIGGGYPIVHDGSVVGGIGISGASSYAEDMQVAEAALQAVGVK